VIAAAQEMGIDHFDYQINCVGYVHATHAAMIIRRLAVSEGHCDFPGHPVLLAEVQRLAAEQSARSDA
jgi:hypothetical protein